MSEERLKTVLITGANRGIGFEFVRQYAVKGWNVIAGARTPEAATELQELAGQHATVSIEKLDVSDPSSIDALAAKLDGVAIDVLINNAGLFGDFASQTFGTIDFD